MSRRKLALLVAFLALALVITGSVAWRNQTGCVSYRNYERIEKGMELEQVQQLLGSSGDEILGMHVPTVPPYAKFSEAPDGWLGVVWGEQFFRWQEKDRWFGGDRTIYVGVSDGRVVSKYLFEHTL